MLFFAGVQQMSEKPVKDYDKFVLRMPDGMRDALAERAKANGRSMNSETLVILSDALFFKDKPDAWLERMMNIISKHDPTKDDERAKFSIAVSEAIMEITKRIEKENNRLTAIAAAQRKFNKKPT